MSRSGRFHLLLMIAAALLAALPAQRRPDPLAEARAKPAVAAPDTGRPVELLDGRTGRPLGGATVLLLPREAGPPEIREAIRRIQTEYEDDLTLAALVAATRFGTKLVTDGSGHVTVPADFRGIAHIVADELHDHTSFAESYEPQIVVFGRRQITVELEFADGTPAAGVGVELAHSHRLSDSSGAECAARADAQGHARIELPPFTLRDGWQTPLWLRALVCGADPDARVRLDPKGYRHRDPGPVRLRLPPLGRLRISALDGDGAARRFSYVSVAQNGVWSELRVSGFDTEVFECLVAPGRSYLVSAAFRHQIGGRDLVIDGPRQASEDVAVGFDQRREALTVGVRLANAMQPHGDVFVTCHELWFLGGGGGTSPDPDGRVWIALTPEQLALGRLTLSARHFSVEPLRPMRSLGAVSFALPSGDDAPRTGVIDLGTRTLAEEPVVLSGRVVDEDGAPVAGVGVFRGVANAILDLPVPQWTDADGRFALRMLHPFPEWAFPLRRSPANKNYWIWLRVSHPDKGSWPPGRFDSTGDRGFEVGETVEIVLRR